MKGINEKEEGGSKAQLELQDRVHQLHDAFCETLKQFIEENGPLMPTQIISAALCLAQSVAIALTEQESKGNYIL